MVRMIHLHVISFSRLCQSVLVHVFPRSPPRR